MPVNNSKRKPKLLYLITRADLAGAQVHLLTLIKGLRHQFDISVITGDGGYLARQCEQLSVPCAVVASLQRSVSPARDWVAYKQLKQHMQALAPDLVHTHSSKAGAVGRMAAQALGISNLHTSHGWSFGVGAPRLRRLLTAPIEKMLARKCSHIIAVCEEDKRIALKYGIGKTPMTVILNGVGDIGVKAHANDTQIVLNVARFSKQKNHDLLLDVVAAMPERSFKLLGHGPLFSNIRSRTQRDDLTNVLLASEHEDVRKNLWDASVFLLTSSWEGLPISILEAMSSGLPVVATRVGGVAEAVSHGQTGLLAPAGDAAQLTQHLRTLLADDSLRKNMGRAARLRYERLFTAQTMIDKTRAVYLSLLNRESD